ncbi:uncharacterized protein [Centruroides vittatus]|uniref:uncharacterized protein n=1 Tax=Centruroides vittatus TaxID=120091 RepID=UPI003510B5D9
MYDFTGENILQIDKTRCRILISGWLLALLVLTPTYSGILTSLLTIPIPSLVAENIKELNEAVRLGKVKAIHYLITLIDGIERVLTDDNYVFICSEEHGIYFATKNGLENYFISKDTFLETHNAIAVAKDFPLTAEFNKIISRLSQGGFFNIWYRQLIEREYFVELFKSGMKGSEKMEEGFGVMKSPFIILISGHIFATTVFFMEIILSRFIKTL